MYADDDDHDEAKQKIEQSATTKIAIAHSTMDKMECLSWWTKSFYLILASTVTFLRSKYKHTAIHRIHRQIGNKRGARAFAIVSSFNVDIFLLWFR